MTKSIFDYVSSKEVKNTSLLQNSRMLFEKIPNPLTIDGDFSETGLVVGKIQSGKTSNIIGLAAYAFDNGYDVTIMLLSNTNNLLKQNYDRISNAFSDASNVKTLIKSSSNSNFELLPKDLERFIDKGNKVILCSLKHYKHINEITKYFKLGSNLNLNVLIIDDEGDDTTQNSKVKKSIVVNETIIEQRSINNKSIIELKNTFRRSCFISVTATPQVQILTQQFQELKPNFLAKILPGDGYTGLVTFHEEQSNYIKEIDDLESTSSSLAIPNSLEMAISDFVLLSMIRSNKLLSLKNAKDTEEKNSLWDKIMYFLRIKKRPDIFEIDNRNRQNFMLIHSVKKLKDQSQIFDKVNDYIALLSEDNSVLIDNFFKMIIRLKNDDYPQYSNVSITKEQLLEVLKSIQVKLLNSSQEINDISKLEFSEYYIIIGADLIDRGITIPDLLVTYMSRESIGPGQIDTLLQRARWFGYRSEYLEFCRIYLTPKLKEQYHQILLHEDEMWDWIEYISSNDYSLRDNDFTFNVNNALLKPTGTDKVFTIRNSFKNAITQLSFTSNKLQNDLNIKLIKNLFIDKEYSSLGNWTNQPHINRDVNYKEFKAILQTFIFPEADPLKQNSKIINKEMIFRNLNQYLKEEDTISLIWMRHSTKTQRSTVKNENTIIALLQGRGEINVNNQKHVYPGDRNIYSSHISCQFHIVTLKNDTHDYSTGDEIALVSVINPFEDRKIDEINRMDLEDVLSYLKKNNRNQV